MSLMEETASKLREAMVSKELSHADLGRLAGVGRSQVSQWLSGRHNMTLATVERLADALDVDVKLEVEER